MNDLATTITTTTYVNWGFFITLGIVFAVFILLILWTSYRRKHRKETRIEGKLVRKVKDDRNEERTESCWNKSFWITS